MHPFSVVASLVRAHALRGTRGTHKLAQILTGEGPRSPHWPTIEKRWKKLHPTCAACGRKLLVQVHHVQSFATHPQLELEDCSGVPPGTGRVGGTPNFISLCLNGKHHIGLGHGGSYQHGGYNPRVVEHAGQLLSGEDPKTVMLLAKNCRVTPPVIRLKP